MGALPLASTWRFAGRARCPEAAMNEEPARRHVVTALPAPTTLKRTTSRCRRVYTRGSVTAFEAVLSCHSACREAMKHETRMRRTPQICRVLGGATHVLLSPSCVGRRRDRPLAGLGHLGPLASSVADFGVGRV